MTSRPNSCLGKASRPSSSGAVGAVKVWTGAVETAPNLQGEMHHLFRVVMVR